MAGLSIEKINNAKSEIEGIKTRLESYYQTRSEIGKDDSTLKNLSAREEGLKRLESLDVDKLRELQKSIDELVEKNGIQYDVSTGMINQTEKIDVDNETKEKIDKLKDELDKTIHEYDSVATALVGDEKPVEESRDEKKEEIEPDQEESENEEQKKQEEKTEEQKPKNKIGVKEKISEQVRTLGQRDVLAKKILEERLKLEVLKDEMDLDAAKHVVNKNRMILQIEQTKLELARKIARGGTMRRSINKSMSDRNRRTYQCYN